MISYEVVEKGSQGETKFSLTSRGRNRKNIEMVQRHNGPDS